MPADVISDVRKIAVLRANALGDYVFTLPALWSLRQAYPRAEIVLLGRAWHKEFIESRPGPVDRVVIVPKCRGIPHENDRVEDADEVERFFREMRDEAFDVALQMHGGGGNSNPFVRSLNARVAAGLCVDDAPPLDINVPYIFYQNEVLRYLEVAAAVGASPVAVAPEVAVTPHDREALRKVIPGCGEPLVVIHPGATDPRRRWPAAKMAALGEVLSANGLKVCITGTADEAPLLDEVTRRCGSRVLNLCGKLSLPAMTGLLAEAELVISNDTGPLHLARAVGTKTIGVYWFGNLLNGPPMTVSGHRFAMSWTTHCPACGMDCVHNDAHDPRDGCAHDVSFVNGISVDEVVAHAQYLLGQSLNKPRLAAL